MPKKSPERLQEEALERQMFANRLKSAKAFRKMTNADIMKRASDLGYPMSKSKVSQSLHGRFLPTDYRAGLWGLIFRVNPLWFIGYGRDDEVMLVNTPEEDSEELNELMRLYAEMSLEQLKLLLQIAKEFRYPYEHPRITVVPKDTNVKIEYKK